MVGETLNTPKRAASSQDWALASATKERRVATAAKRMIVDMDVCVRGRWDEMKLEGVLVNLQPTLPFIPRLG